MPFSVLRACRTNHITTPTKTVAPALTNLLQHSLYMYSQIHRQVPYNWLGDSKNATVKYIIWLGRVSWNYRSAKWQVCCFRRKLHRSLFNKTVDETGSTISQGKLVKTWIEPFGSQKRLEFIKTKNPPQNEERICLLASWTVGSAWFLPGMRGILPSLNASECCKPAFRQILTVKLCTSARQQQEY